ncbi:MAG: hypothetical protein WA755_18865 [Candidatus Acidiferrales bacterium]
MNPAHGEQMAAPHPWINFSAAAAMRFLMQSAALQALAAGSAVNCLAATALAAGTHAFHRFFCHE